MGKKLVIAGNWKSNKTLAEADIWLREFQEHSAAQETGGTIIIAAPFTLLSFLKETIAAAKLPLQLSAQNVSPFDDGAYTGEVSSRQVKELADWVIIGHSERRKHFSETDEVLFRKAERAKTAGLRVIYCVPDEKTELPKISVDVVAYEPVWAIGSGKADSPENANGVIASIKQRTSSMVIYGGSVTSENVASFVGQPAIDGVLPGGASLDPHTFAALIEAGVLAAR